MRLAKCGLYILFILDAGCAPSLDKNARSRALRPIESFVLHGKERMEIVVTIPSDREWQKIIAVFGDPTYVIAPVLMEKQLLMCMQNDARLSVHDSRGRQLPILEAGLPYGWSSNCTGEFVKKNGFRAQPGEKVIIDLLVPNNISQEYVVAANWKNAKDKLVGLEIHDLMSK